MTLQEAMEEIFGHGFLFTLRPTKGRKALWIIHKALQEYQDQQLNPTLRWIPCSERMPDPHAKVLFVTFGKSVWYGKYCGIRNGRKRWETSKFVSPFWDDEVTHWIPVPDAPAKEKPPQDQGR